MFSLCSFNFIIGPQNKGKQNFDKNLLALCDLQRGKIGHTRNKDTGTTPCPSSGKLYRIFCGTGGRRVGTVNRALCFCSDSCKPFESWALAISICWSSACFSARLRPCCFFSSCKRNNSPSSLQFQPAELYCPPFGQEKGRIDHCWQKQAKSHTYQHKAGKCPVR